MEKSQFERRVTPEEKDRLFEIASQEMLRTLKREFESGKSRAEIKEALKEALDDEVETLLNTVGPDR